MKGKIYSDKGLFYPRIMIVDSLGEVVEQVRRDSKNTVEGFHEELHYGNERVRGCFSGSSTAQGAPSQNSGSFFGRCMQCTKPSNKGDSKNEVR